jgi:hypothetical protein
VLASQIVRNISTNFINGWAALNFFPPSIAAPKHQLIGGATARTTYTTGAPVVTTQAAAVYNGLPVVGFAAQYFNNGTLTVTAANGQNQNVQAFYTGAFVNKYTRNIQ